MPEDNSNSSYFCPVPPCPQTQMLSNLIAVHRIREDKIGNNICFLCFLYAFCKLALLAEGLDWDRDLRSDSGGLLLCICSYQGFCYALSFGLKEPFSVWSIHIHFCHVLSLALVVGKYNIAYLRLHILSCPVETEHFSAVRFSAG